MRFTFTSLKKFSLFVYISLFALSFSAQSQVSTIFPGTWSSNSTWNSNVPLNTSIVYINHRVSLDVDIAIDQNGYYEITESGSLIDIGSKNIQVSGSGTLDVNGKVHIDGNLQLNNSGKLYVRSNDTLIVGNAEFTNNATVVIEPLAVMIVNGDLALRNSNNTTLDGNLYVNGNVSARNSATVLGNGTLEATGEVDLSNNTSFFNSTNPCSPGPCEYGSGGGLPIQLLRFNAYHVSNGNVQLEWQTESEINNDYFVIEKSNDGFVFSEVAKVDGAGNSMDNRNYSVLVPSDPEVTYYRLTQVDINGASKSFNPIVLEASLNYSDEDLTLHPNPVHSTNILSIHLKDSEVNNLMEIRDMSGQLILEQTLNGDAVDVEIDSRFKSGIYFVTVINSSKTLREKLVITK